VIPGAPGSALAGYLVVLLVQRAGELMLSRRNLARVLARGGQEVAAGHFPGFVLLHAAYPVALVLEVVLGARPGPAWPVWVGLWLAAQGLRMAAIHALGDRWNVRIVVVPGEPPVRSGVYRWLRHPNYLAVALEFVAAPMAFGAWRTALVFTALDAGLLAVRIRREERALADACH